MGLVGPLIAVAFLDDGRDTRQAMVEMLMEGLPMIALSLVDPNDQTKRRLAQSEMTDFTRLRAVSWPSR